MADIYARDFMKQMNYSNEDDMIPLLDFREKLLNQQES